MVDEEPRRGVNADELEKILELHDENTRRIVRDTIRQDLPKIVGEAVTEALSKLNIERVDRVLFGDPPMHDGLVTTTAAVFGTVEKHEDLLNQTRLVLRLAKYLLPVMGVAGLAQLAAQLPDVLHAIFGH